MRVCTVAHRCLDRVPVLSSQLAGIVAAAKTASKPAPEPAAVSEARAALNSKELLQWAREKQSKPLKQSPPVRKPAKCASPLL